MESEPGVGNRSFFTVPFAVPPGPPPLRVVPDSPERAQRHRRGAGPGSLEGPDREAVVDKAEYAQQM